MSVQLQIVCAGSEQVRIELTITQPHDEPTITQPQEELTTVQSYVEPGLFSPVKRNAVSISLAGEEGGSVTADDVRGMFSFAGAIESFEVHEKGQAAVVTYSDEQAANTAMLLNDSFLAGSPVCVSALIVDSAEAEVCSPVPRFARLNEAEQEEQEADELVLFSPTKMAAASESELTYARTALHNMAAAGYTLGGRALCFIAKVDARFGPSIRQSASELGQAASEMVAPVSEKISEYTSSIAGNVTARQLSSATYATYASSVDVASSVVSQTTEVAGIVAEGVSQVAMQVRELDAEHGISQGISTSLRAGAATALATGSSAMATARGAAPVEFLPSQASLKHGVEKGRVLANIALAKGQRIFFSCPSPAKPLKPRTPARPSVPSVLAAECHLADTLEPTYA